LEKIERVEGNPWVIVGILPGARLSDLQHSGSECAHELVLRTSASMIFGIRSHRRAVAAGQGLPMIGKLLGHSQVQTTARYAHLAAAPVKSAAEEVSASIAAITRA
jgi:integrase